MTIRASIIGCGYVADFYAATLCNHPQLEIAGAFDRDEARLRTYCSLHRFRAYASYDDVLADESVQLVINLTNPSSHFEVSERALRAGKHVYSEKPLCLTLDHAERLAALSVEHGVTLRCAPSSLRSGAAQALISTLRCGAIGRPRLVYAELEAGPIHLEGYRDWRSLSGAPWPAEDEFALGCTLEHLGYYLTWLCHIFGPVRRGTSWSSLQIEDKGTGQERNAMAPDFSCACLEFDRGVVARMTCGMLAPKDLTLRVFGDAGSVVVEDAWDYRSRVTVRDIRGVKLRDVPVSDDAVLAPAPSAMDFARGPAEQARAIEDGAEGGDDLPMLVHVTEVSLLIANAVSGSVFVPRTSFGPSSGEGA